MPYEIDTTSCPGLARVTFFDTADFSELRDANIELAPNGRFEQLLRLWDLRGIAMTLSTDEIVALTELSKSFDPGDSKIAMLVSSDVAFGFSSMYGGFGADESRSICIFKEEPEALEWLLDGGG